MYGALKHFATSHFWECYERLPEQIRYLADKNFKLLKSNPRHRWLHFKCYDLGMWFWQPGRDREPPNLKACMDRAVITGQVAHTAIEDALVVVKLD